MLCAGAVVNHHIHRQAQPNDHREDTGRVAISGRQLASGGRPAAPQNELAEHAADEPNLSASAAAPFTQVNRVMPYRINRTDGLPDIQALGVTFSTLNVYGSKANAYTVRHDFNGSVRYSIGGDIGVTIGEELFGGQCNAYI
jgi:hypothetical protein